MKKGCLAHCKSATETIRRELGKFGTGAAEHPSRLRAFTLRLIEAAGLIKDELKTTESLPQVGTTESGTIRWYDDWKGFGFIERDAGGDIFVHHSGISEVPWHLRHEGTHVSYTVTQGPSSLKADQVHIEK